MAVQPDPATMGQNAPITPQPAPPAQDTTAPDIDTSATAPTGGPVPGATGPQPAPSLPKESFGEGFQRERNPQYTTDAEGNVIRSEPARKVSVGGVLGKILAGALQGAVRGVSAQTPPGAEGKGAAFSAGASAAEKGRILADQRARDIAQKNFENKQAATAAKVKNNLDLAQIAHITQLMNFAAEQEPGVLRAQKLGNDAAAIKLVGDQQQMLKDSLEFQDQLVSKGQLDPQFMQLYTEHSAELNAQVPSLVGGSMKALQNGKRGEENGVFLIPTDVMKNAVIPKGVNLVYNTYGQLDSKGRLVSGSVAYTKDGTPIPTSNALTGDGKHTLLDYYNSYLTGQRELYQASQMTLSDLTLQQKKAEAEKAKAQAEQAAGAGALSQAEAEMLKSSGLSLPENYKPVQGAFLMNPQDLKSQLQAQGVQVPNDFDQLYAIAHYKGDLKDYPTRVTKGTGQKSEAQAAAQIRALINPNFSETTFPAIKKQVEEYASTKAGTAGGNIISFNTAVSHLRQGYEAAKALKNRDARAWNAITNELGLQAGASSKVVFDTIRAAYVGEIGKTFKGGPADIPEREEIEKVISSNASPQQILDFTRTEASLMQSKSDSLINQFYGWTGELPPNAIDNHTVEEYKKLGLDPFHGLPAKAQVSLGGTGNQNPNQPPTVQFAPVPSGFAIPQGAKPLWSKTTGAFLGSQTPEQAQQNKYTPYTPPAGGHK